MNQGDIKQEIKKAVDDIDDFMGGLGEIQKKFIGAYLKRFYIIGKLEAIGGILKTIKTK